MADADSDREVINAVKTSIQDNVTDPRQQYTNTSRTWIHTDKPLLSATYPRIQVRKRGASTSVISDIGPEFLEWRSMILDIQFWTKAPFRWKNTDNTYLSDEELVREWLHKIWVAEKADLLNLRDENGITGLRMMDEDEPFQEPDTQLYTGIVSIRFWYFRT